MINTRQKGSLGELIVVQYIEKKGFIIRAQNVISRQGEIDIIAQKDNLYAFIEVKLRQHNLLTISELVPRSKQRKIIQTTRYFIAKNNLPADEYIFRFDIALIEQSANTSTTEPVITYIEDAFRYE